MKSIAESSNHKMKIRSRTIHSEKIIHIRFVVCEANRRYAGMASRKIACCLIPLIPAIRLLFFKRRSAKHVFTRIARFAINVSRPDFVSETTKRQSVGRHRQKRMNKESKGFVIVRSPDSVYPFWQGYFSCVLRKKNHFMGLRSLFCHTSVRSKNSVGVYIFVIEKAAPALYNCQRKKDRPTLPVTLV